MLKLFIAADDFTGALDTGVQCAKHGISTLVTTLSADQFRISGEMNNSVEVLVVDTESRHVEPGTAYERVYHWITFAKELGVLGFYKKTDSVMRGNIAAELAAALEAANRKTLYFIPAFPMMGRTVLGGNLYVHDTLVTQTSFANDPFTPVTKDHIADLLTYDSNGSIISTTIDKLNQVIQKDKKQIIVLDSQNDEELEAISFNLRTENHQAVFAGCAGFANYLPNMFSFLSHPLPPSPKAKSFLFINGSLNAVTMGQIAYAESKGFTSLALQPRDILINSFCDSPDCESLLLKMKETIETTGKLILKTSNGEHGRQEIDRLAQELKMPMEKLHLIIADNFGKLVARFLRQKPVDVLCVFGGDTLHGVLSHVGCSLIEPQKEILPGIVESQLYLKNPPYTLVSKSGGFGEKDVIDKIIVHFS